MYKKNNQDTLFSRFRGFYPVVIDVETAGFDAKIDALLEIAAITLSMTEEGWLKIDQTVHFHIEPFIGSRIQPESIAFNKIDPYNPSRNAVSEYEALYNIFDLVWRGIKNQKCNRGIIVGHNATFDHNFLMAAAERVGIKNENPFHSFSILDTVSLSALILGQTVLSKACSTAGIPFNNKEAHSALYDTEKTALLFCELVNRWKRLGGWPISM